MNAADEDPDDTATTLWRRTVEVLVSKGSSPTEAIDGANMIVAAYRRTADEDRVPESGRRPTR